MDGDEGAVASGVSQRLRRAGLRPTILRISMLEIFAKHDAPMSCEEVFGHLCRADIPGSFSGVQRNMQALTRSGLLCALSVPDRARPRTLYALSEQGKTADSKGDGRLK